MIFPELTKFFLTAGSGEGLMPLNAFDHALLDAKVGNTNLIKLSSIIPPKCQKVEAFPLKPGIMQPLAYASKVSGIPGEVIAAAVACALPEDDSLPGVIMEYSNQGHQEEIESICRKMAEEALKHRGYKIKEIVSISKMHKVVANGAVFAGVIFG